MEQKLKFSNGYTCNRVINGCWQLSAEHCLQGQLDFEDAMHAFHALVERGFTTFDCADIYTGVEEFIGKFVLELKRSHNYSHDLIQIHTKYVPDLKDLANVDFAYTEKVIDRSLERLHRETLDLVQFHWWDWDVPGYMETIEDLYKLQKKGKILNIGMCNFDTKHLKEVVDAGFCPVSNQTQYSVFDRRPEKQLLQYSKEHDIKSFCYGTLSGGFLSEKWIGKEFNPENRSLVKYQQVIEDTLGWDGFQKILLLLQDIANKHGVSIANVATQYILTRPSVGACMVGVRNSKHVESNVKIFSFDLDEDDLSQIENFVKKYPILEGDPFELERAPGKYKNIMKMNLGKND